MTLPNQQFVYDNTMQNLLLIVHVRLVEIQQSNYNKAKEFYNMDRMTPCRDRVLGVNKTFGNHTVMKSLQMVVISSIESFNEIVELSNDAGIKKRMARAKKLVQKSYTLLSNTKYSRFV